MHPSRRLPPDEKKRRQELAKEMYFLRKKRAEGKPISRRDAKRLDHYNATVRTKGRPWKGATTPPPPPAAAGAAPPPPTTAAAPTVEVHHLDELRALPPHIDEKPTDEKFDATDEKPETVHGTVLCKVCGRAEPCAVHPRGAEPFAPAVDVPDPAKATDEKQEKKKGAGFEGRMKGLVAMGSALLKGIGAELRAAGKWYAYPDEFVDEFWQPHAEDTTAELAAAAQKTLGVSDETISGVITFGVPIAAVVAVRGVRAEQKKKGTSDADAQKQRAAAEQEAARAQATAAAAQPQPEPSAEAKPNGVQSPSGSRVHLEPEVETVDDLS